jgi:hypothetical protein
MYYDPAKEEAEERKKALDPSQIADPAERMRARIRNRWQRPEPSMSDGYKYVRIIIYLAFAAFAIYFIFFTDSIQKLVSTFLR